MAHAASDVLIVGAGPTGLAAALFLAAKGISCRIIDKSPEPSHTSRAQVVNPRSLELLTPSGVASDMLAEGFPLRRAHFYEDWAPIAEIDLGAIPSPYPMTALTQARSEALLAHALRDRDIFPERGVALDAFGQDADAVEAILTHADGQHETVRARLMLAADGAHSVVRQTLGLSFDGSAFPEDWPLYDLVLNDPVDVGGVHVSFVPRGLIFMMAIRPGLWRVLGDMEEPLDHLPPGSKPGLIEWRSNFHVAHRVASKAAAGRVMLAGDAAHIHAPLGARGMNLGIEDAYVFADCAAGALAGNLQRIEDYGRLRHPVHMKLVRRIERLTTIARGQPEVLDLVRHYLLPGVTHIGPLRNAMMRMASGLDHSVRTH